MTTFTTETLPEPITTASGFRGRFLPSDDPDVLVAESWAPAGSGAGPLHYHLHQEERFEVLDGEITVRLGRTHTVVRTGESFVVPAGAAHTFLNHTDDEAHFRTYFSPALRTRELFTELFTMENRGSLRESARLMGDYRDEYFYLAAIPVRLQRAAGAVTRALFGTRR